MGFHKCCGDEKDFIIVFYYSFSNTVCMIPGFALPIPIPDALQYNPVLMAKTYIDSPHSCFPQAKEAGC